MATHNAAGLYYPLTKMNFYVHVDGITNVAAFNEVTGIDATVEVIEFRQGNAHSLAPVKIPGLVKHGNITLKMGYTRNQDFKNWVINCVDERRKEVSKLRKEITIELIDIGENSPQKEVTSIGQKELTWIFKGAWVTKYSGVDLNASTSEVAIETVEIAYEELVIPN